MAAEDPRSVNRRFDIPGHTHEGPVGHPTYHSAVVRQAVAFDAMKEVFPDLSTAFLTHLPQDEAVHMFKNVSRKRAVAYLTKPALLGIMENSLVRMLAVGDKRLGIKNSSLTKAHSLSVDGGKSVRYDWPEHVMDWVGIPAFEAALKQGIAQDEQWRAFVVASDRAPKIAGVGPRRPATPTSSATKLKAAATASETHTSTQKTDTGTEHTHRNGDATHSTHDHGKQARLTPSKHDSTQSQATAVQPAGGDEAKTNALTEEHTHARQPQTHPDTTQPGPPTHTHPNTHPQPPAHRPSASSLAAAAAVTLAASTPSTTTQDATTAPNDAHASDASRDEANPAPSSSTASSSALSSPAAGRPSAPTASDATGHEEDDEARPSSSSTASQTLSPTAKGPSAAATGTTSAQAESAVFNGRGSESTGSTRASTTDSAQSSVRDEKETMTGDGSTGGGGGGEDEERAGVGGKQAKRRAGESGSKGGDEGAKAKGQGERQGKQGKGERGETEGKDKESSAANKRKRQMLSATEFLASTTTLPSSSAQPRKRTATSSPPHSPAASSNKSALPKRPPVGAKPSVTQAATKGGSTSPSSSSTSRSSKSGNAKSGKDADSHTTRGRKRPPMPTRSHQQVKEEGSKTPRKAGQKGKKEAETSGEARVGVEGGRGDGGRGVSNSRGKKRGHDDDMAPSTKDACNGRDDDHQGVEAISVRGGGRKTANSLAAAVNAALGGIVGIDGTGSGKSPRAKKPKTSSASSSAATTNTTPPPAAASSSLSAAASAGGKGGGGGGDVAPMNVVDDVDDYMVSVRKELLGLTRGGNQELTYVSLRAFHALVNGDKAMVVALQTAKSMEMPVSEVALNILVGLERAKATPPLDTQLYTHHAPPNPPTSNPPTSVSTPTPASPAV